MQIISKERFHHSFFNYYKDFSDIPKDIDKGSSDIRISSLLISGGKNCLSHFKTEDTGSMSKQRSTSRQRGVNHIKLTERPRHVLKLTSFSPIFSTQHSDYYSPSFRLSVFQRSRVSIDRRQWKHKDSNSSLSLNIRSLDFCCHCPHLFACVLAATTCPVMVTWHLHVNPHDSPSSMKCSLFSHVMSYDV